jgi:serine/threonine protein kinase
MIFLVKSQFMSDTSALQPQKSVGAGRFSLLRALGRGGMGEVWLAQDERLHEPVALKFLPSEVRADPVALDDLRRETARSHRLTHPNIVRIHDLHEEPGGMAFIAMEFVDGPTLASLRLEQPSRVLPWDYLVPLVQQLCAALDYAHGEKVVHRDLKPANVMLDSRGRLKLADFGIAATVSDSVSRVSHRHATSGTLPYMSPQQVAGKRPQVSDDVYALGATLYELLTSKPPFFTGDITHQVLHEPPEPPDERLAGLELANPIPPDVAALIMACLAKDPAQRPSSARAVAEWIGLEITPKPSTASLAEAMFPATDSSQQSTAAEQAGPIDSAPTPGRAKPALLLSGLTALLVLAGAGAWYAVRHGRGNDPANPPPRADTATAPARSADSTANSSPAGASFEPVKAPAVAFNGSLADTTWLVSDSAGDRYSFQFAANGALRYEAARAVRPNGKWDSDGNSVNLDINNGYATFSGKISGKKITGQARSKNGQTWTWEATLKN